MEQKITVKHEVGIIIPRLTNPATPEDVARNKQYIDGQGVVQKGTLKTDRLVSDFLTIRKNTMSNTSGTFSGTLNGALNVISTNDGLIGFSMRPKESYVHHELGSAVLRRGEYWEARRWVKNYYDNDTMIDDPMRGISHVNIPLNGYVGDMVFSVKGNQIGWAGDAQSFEYPIVYDANGNMMGVHWTVTVEAMDGDTIVRQGRVFTVPEGAARVEFRITTKEFRESKGWSGGVEEFMLTPGNTIGADYFIYDGGWETVTGLDADAVLPMGSIYDYFTAENTNVE